MNMSRDEKQELAWLVFGACVLATVAVIVAVNYTGFPWTRHGQPIFLITLISLLGTASLAWLARRLVVGSVAQIDIEAKPVQIFGGFRLANLLAAFVMLLASVLALVFGSELADTLVRVTFILLFLTVFTGLAGGAILNSVAVWRQIKKRDFH